MNPRETAPSRLSDARTAAPEAYEFAGFHLLPSQRRLTSPNGEVVTIAAKAYEALLYLIQHAGQLVPREALMQALWPSTIVEDNNLSQAIAALRGALGDQHVVTVAGRGYQFVPPVTIVRATPPAATSTLAAPPPIDPAADTAARGRAAELPAPAIPPSTAWA